MLNGKKKLVAIAGAVLAVGAIGGGAAVATGELDDNEKPITGEALEKASAAALTHTGAGRVTGTEMGDEGSYYEVEVALDDGSQVEVQLDKDFKVVGDEVDDDSGENEQDDDDDGNAGDAEN